MTEKNQESLREREREGGGGGRSRKLVSVARPAGGVNHPDSVLAKVGKQPAKKALR